MIATVLWMVLAAVVIVSGVALTRIWWLERDQSLTSAERLDEGYVATAVLIRAAQLGAALFILAVVATVVDWIW